jgi:enoyl-CoA hydratase/carnithine racemase
VDYTEIAYEVDDRVATITLDRPDRLNAFTFQMHRELLDVFDQIDADDDVRVVIVTGRGRGFCAGADLGGGGGTFDSSGAPKGTHRDEGGLVTLRIFKSTKPVIAAVNGPAVGVGVTMTLPMDIRLASEDAKFGFVFARRGIVPEAASSWFLPRVVGINKAVEWTYTGRVFPATEACEAGLVRSVHPPDQLLPAAHELAREIVDNTSAVSVALTRQMMWRMLGEPHPMSAHRIDSRGINYMGASADANEGVMSFLEKRPANFTMKPSEDMPDFYPWWEEPEFS